jgi:Bacterial regulatory proteins, tetR family
VRSSWLDLKTGDNLNSMGLDPHHRNTDQNLSPGENLPPGQTIPGGADTTGQDPHRLQAHERILRAAITLFGQQGYDNTTIRAITSRAGTDVGAIHYHYSDKTRLYRKAIETCVARLSVNDPLIVCPTLADRDQKAYYQLVKILSWEILAPSGQNITQIPLLASLCEKDEPLMGLKTVIEILMKTGAKS